MQRAPSPQLIVALDNCSVKEALQIVDELRGVGVSWFKVGLELYALAGTSIVSELKKLGVSVFVDLKLHDIPNTVAKAVSAVASTGADLLTVHCSGGPHMLTEAQRMASGSSLKLLGVTVLTSTDPTMLSAMGLAWGAKQAPSRASLVAALGRFAVDAKLAGLVCSVPDLQNGCQRGLVWSSPLLVTPGIRRISDAKDDQASVATAADAVRAGATHLVVGRPITALNKEQRSVAARAFLTEISDALTEKEMK